MKLRNKKTGEIRELPDGFFCGDNLKKICKDWEDYEEPEDYWYVSCDGRALKATTVENEYNEKHITGHKQIDNYFETKEEAEKAVEKLKAWKRLKDKGFQFDKVSGCWIEFSLKSFDSEEECEQAMKDLDLLFGGEE